MAATKAFVITDSQTGDAYCGDRLEWDYTDTPACARLSDDANGEVYAIPLDRVGTVERRLFTEAGKPVPYPTGQVA